MTSDRILCPDPVRGFTLIELLLAMALLGILAGAAAAVLRTTERGAAAQLEATEAAETVRITASVLGAELRYIDPAEDLRVFSADSLGLRAFRGIAFVCAPGPAAGAVAVRYRGVREPEPAKDSVVLAGARSALALSASGAAASACAAATDERIYRWTLTGPAPQVGTALLLFERGSYHLAGDALRYRRGLGGRQPLTPELIDTRRSAFEALPPIDPGRGGAVPAALRLEVVVPSRIRRRWPGPVADLRVRLPLVNAPAGPQGAAPP